MKECSDAHRADTNGVWLTVLHGRQSARHVRERISIVARRKAVSAAAAWEEAGAADLKPACIARAMEPVRLWAGESVVRVVDGAVARRKPGIPIMKSQGLKAGSPKSDGRRRRKSMNDGVAQG